jgi:hypothetical protein
MRYLLFALLNIICFESLAQQKNIERANKFYLNSDYINAIKEYEKCNVNDLTIDVKKKIINCYRLTNQIAKSERYLNEVCLTTKEESFCNLYLNLLIQKKDYTKIKSLSEKEVFKIDYSGFKNQIEALQQQLQIIV